MTVAQGSEGRETLRASVELNLLARISAALGVLADTLEITESASPASHTALEITGLTDPGVATALATYLVGCVAGAVDVDAQLSGALLASGSDARAEMSQAIERLVGVDNEWTSPTAIRFRDTQRNAWIAEGFAHALLVLRREVRTPLLPGPVLAIVPLHTIPSESGLDAIALYADGDDLVVAIGESKASRLYGSQMLTDAAGIYSKIDQNLYGVELRAALTSFRHVLPPEAREQVSDALWRSSRCYLPTIIHELEFDPGAHRLTLARLIPGADRRRLGSVRLREFHAFFDEVADEMRRVVAEEWT